MVYPIHIEATGHTHTGRVRAANEDCFAVLSHLNLFMVADGMGGHSSGEVASLLAVNTVEAFFNDPALGSAASPEEAKARLVESVKLANQRILRAASADEKKRGMGTTFAGVLVQGSSVCLAHVGDSRIYRLRRGRLERLTRDHAALRPIPIQNDRAAAAAGFRSIRHVLTRALGLQEGIRVDARIEAAEPEDLLLLCSDGLAGVVGDDELLGILETEAPLDTTAWALIERANEYGGPDNVTCVLLRWSY